MYSTFYLHIILVFSYLLLLPTQPLLGSLAVSSTPGETHEVAGFTGFATTSAEMVGLQILVYFENGSTDLGIWTPTGINQNGWSVTQGTNQSTFAFPFTLSNNTSSDITRFTLNGSGSTTFFDRSAPAPGTAGSANGRDLLEVTNLSDSQDISAVYFNEVQVIGSTPQGDLFTGIDVSFSGGVSGNNGQFAFVADTDTSFGFVTSTIPEPSSAIQFGIAMTVLLMRRRRRPSL